MPKGVITEPIVNNCFCKYLYSPNYYEKLQNLVVGTGFEPVTSA